MKGPEENDDSDGDGEENELTQAQQRWQVCVASFFVLSSSSSYVSSSFSLRLLSLFLALR